MCPEASVILTFGTLCGEQYEDLFSYSAMETFCLYMLFLVIEYLYCGVVQTLVMGDALVIMVINVCYTNNIKIT